MKLYFYNQKSFKEKGGIILKVIEKIFVGSLIILFLLIFIKGSGIMGSNGIMGNSLKSSLENFTIKSVTDIGGGSIKEGIGLAAVARQPDDPKNTPHFYIAIRARGITTSKIIIYDVDTGKPVGRMIVDDK